MPLNQIYATADAPTAKSAIQRFVATIVGADPDTQDRVSPRPFGLTANLTLNNSPPIIVREMLASTIAEYHSAVHTTID